MPTMETNTYVVDGKTRFRMEGVVGVPEHVNIEGIHHQLDGIASADPQFKVYFDEWNSDIQPLSHA